MATVPSGLVGGLLGAIATGVAMRATSDDPGPAAIVWAMYMGDGDPTHYERQGAGVHLIYGALAGAIFTNFANSLSLGLTSASSSIGWGVVWAGVLAIIAVGLWSMVVIGDGLDQRSLARLGALHFGYGVVLGLWVYYVPGF